MSRPDPTFSTQLEEVRTWAGSLAWQLGELAQALSQALEEMEGLRHHATSVQRRLAELDSQNPESVPWSGELGWELRWFQEAGRLLETAAEPLRLTARDLAQAMQAAEQRLGTMAGQEPR